MAWHPDIPSIPIKKPKEIETLELMDRVLLDSMTPLEVHEKVEEIAHSVARDCKAEVKNGNFDTCLGIVSVALRITGSAIGGQVGKAMIAECDTAALKASREAFPEDTAEF
jgi:hypothetical protein